PRSSMNFAFGLTSSSSTPSCSTMISFTLSSTDFAMNPSPPAEDSPPSLHGSRATASLHVEAAIDVEDLTRHVRRRATAQESYHLGHLGGSSAALEGHRGQQRLGGLARDARRHVRLDEPGRHCVDQDV